MSLLREIASFVIAIAVAIAALVLLWVFVADKVDDHKSAAAPPMQGQNV